MPGILIMELLTGDVRENDIILAAEKTDRSV